MDHARIIKNFGIKNITIPKILEIRAKKNPDKIFLYYQDQKYSYKEINEITNKLANGLMEVIKYSDINNPNIGVLLSDSPDYLFSWFSISKINSIFVPIERFLEKKIFKHVINTADVEILITEFKFLNRFESNKEGLPKVKKVIIKDAPPDFSFNKDYIKYEDLFTTNSNNKIDTSVDPFEIQFTQGVTGIPKAIKHKFPALLGFLAGIDFKDIGLNRNSKILCLMSLFSGKGRSTSILPALFFNASVIIPKKITSQYFWENVEKYEPNGMTYVGSSLIELLTNRFKEMERSNTIKWAAGFGAVEELWTKFERRFGIPLYDCWGMEESIGITVNKQGSEDGKLGSVGKAPYFVELKIVDENGNEQPPGSQNYGEIIFKNKESEIFEYYKPPNNSTSKINDRGWFYTGDIGYKDIDGYIYLKGRKSDLIKKADEKIFARDIEKIVNQHPYIVASAVFTLPHKKYDVEDIYLFVERRRGYDIDFKMLTEYLKQNLPFFMVPKYIKFKDKLPRYENSNILKWKLKEEIKQKRNKITIWDSQQMYLVNL